MYVYTRTDAEGLYLYDVSHRRAGSSARFILEKLFSRVVVPTLYTSTSTIYVYECVNSIRGAIVPKMIHHTRRVNCQARHKFILLILDLFNMSLGFLNILPVTTCYCTKTKSYDAFKNKVMKSVTSIQWGSCDNFSTTESVRLHTM